MKNILFAMLIAVFTLGLALPSFAQDDTSVVDLSDKTSDVVHSPSLENETPAGQAPGGPIEEEEETEEDVEVEE